MSDTQPNEQPEGEEQTDERQAPSVSDVLTEGFYKVHEGDDNAIAQSDPDFIGIAPEYQNYADETLMPRAAEEGPEQDLEERAKDWAASIAEQSSKVGIHGYSPNAKHPSEARQPAADMIDKQRRALDKSAR